MKVDAIEQNTSILYKRPGAFEETRFEKIHNVVFKNSFEGSKKVAAEIATIIMEKQRVPLLSKYMKSWFGH